MIALPSLDRDSDRSHSATCRAAYNFYRESVRSVRALDVLRISNKRYRYTYPGTWINAFVAGGLIYLHLNKQEEWSSPWHTHLPVTVVFLLLNIFLAVTPFVPPTDSWDAEGYPYYVFPVVGTGVLLLGVVYWAVYMKLWPRLGGYRIEVDENNRRVRSRSGEIQEGKGLINPSCIIVFPF